MSRCPPAVPPTQSKKPCTGRYFAAKSSRQHAVALDERSSGSSFCTLHGKFSVENVASSSAVYSPPSGLMLVYAALGTYSEYFEPGFAAGNLTSSIQHPLITPSTS
eukprot:3933785-Rhodomonas_salina.1